ncbi:hypothetical protein B0H16DRAFT_1719484 [Mycena metata]|uniref:Uncharacterized protein n=1 Tax=Mycena metata TaxID=1033252 RepID=A0AAD7JF26_9AGAR|nr:hypothetical protein B0H16DRAFT_1719484 [Mycena metata]
MNAASSSSQWASSSGSSSGSSSMSPPTFTNPLGVTNPGLRSESSPPARGQNYPAQQWAPNHRITPAEMLQNADHNALIMSGNPPYARLVTLYTEKSTKYEILEQAYILLATSVPQVFRIIPNVLSLDLPSDFSPAANNSNSLPADNSRSHDNFPLVQFWNRKDFKENDVATIGDDEKHQKLGFIEHEDGSQYTEEEIKAQRKCARTAFETLLLRGLAPPTWSQATSVAVNWFRAEMLTHCPDLGLCSANWKVDILATEVYSQWIRRRRDEIQEKAQEEATLKHKPEASRRGQKRKIAMEDDDGEQEDGDLAVPAKKQKQQSDSKSDKSKTRKEEKRRGKKKATSEPSVPLVSPAPAEANTSELTIPEPLAPTITLSAPAPPRIANPIHTISLEQYRHCIGRAVAAGEAVQPSSSSTASKKPKPKPRKPGVADTPWNLFARQHMKQNTKHTTPEVRAVFNAISADELNGWKVKAATKTIEKGGKAPAGESDADGDKM